MSAPTLPRGLSGRVYVAGQIRGEDAPARGTGRRGYRQIPVASPHRCDHTFTICRTLDCLTSWALDWQLFPNRTHAGRRFVTDLNLTHADLEALAAEPFHTEPWTLPSRRDAVVGSRA